MNKQTAVICLTTNTAHKTNSSKERKEELGLCAVRKEAETHFLSMNEFAVQVFIKHRAKQRGRESVSWIHQGENSRFQQVPPSEQNSSSNERAGLESWFHLKCHREALLLALALTRVLLIRLVPGSALQQPPRKRGLLEI